MTDLSNTIAAYYDNSLSSFTFDVSKIEGEDLIAFLDVVYIGTNFKYFSDNVAARNVRKGRKLEAVYVFTSVLWSTRVVAL